MARTRAYQCYLDGEHVLVGGWLARARRLVGDDPRERLWLEVFDAMEDPDAVAREARLRAVEGRSSTSTAGCCQPPAATPRPTRR